MKYQLYLVLSLMASTLMAKAPLPGKESGILKVGVVLPLSGSQKSYGHEALVATKLAIKNFGQRYPAVAQKIRLHVADDHSTSKGTKLAIESLLVKRPSIYLGAIAWPAARELAKFIYKKKKPLILPTVPASLFRAYRPYVFSTSFSQEAQGYAIARFLESDLNSRMSGLMVGSKDIHGRLIGEAFAENYVRAQRKLLHSLRYRVEDIATVNFMSELKDPRLDTVVFPLSMGDELMTLLQRARALKIKIPFVGGEAWHQSSIVNELKAAPHINYFVTTHTILDQNRVSQNFGARFSRQVGRKPGLVAAMYYDAVMFIADGFRRAQSNESERLTASMKESVPISGLHGMMMSKDHVVERTAIVLKVGYGSQEFVQVIPPKGLTKLHAKRR